jgi:hypothetical protein
VYPVIAAALFTADRLPKKPYCSNDKTASRIRSTSEALKYAYLQPNPPGLLYWMVFDIDRDDAVLRFEDVFAPPPNLVVSNYHNGHAHYFYALKTPVNTGENGRDHPKRYAEAIYRSLAAKLGADMRYSRLIAKNPLHPAFFTVSHRSEAYELSELADYLDLNAWKTARRRAGREVNDAGRNCTLFDTLRAWSYEWVTEYKSNGAGFDTWQAACLTQAELLNEFPGADALPASEVKATAKSVSKFAWKRYTGTGAKSSDFVGLQSARGKLKGAKKRENLLAQALALASTGHSQRQIARQLAVDQKTISNWVRNYSAVPAAPAPTQAPPSAPTPPRPLTPIPAPTSLAEERAWIYFDHVLPNQSEFWWVAWNDRKLINARLAVPWCFPPKLLVQPDAKQPDGTRVRHIEMMMKRIEANERACGRPPLW